MHMCQPDKRALLLYSVHKELQKHRQPVHVSPRSFIDIQLDSPLLCCPVLGTTLWVLKLPLYYLPLFSVYVCISIVTNDERYSPNITKLSILWTFSFTDFMVRGHYMSCKSVLDQLPTHSVCDLQPGAQSFWLKDVGH